MPFHRDGFTPETPPFLVLIEVALIVGLAALIHAVYKSTPKRPPAGATRTIVEPLPTQPLSPTARAAQIFERIDTEGSGEIDRDELFLALKLAIPSAKPSLSHADVDALIVVRCKLSPPHLKRAERGLGPSKGWEPFRALWCWRRLFRVLLLAAE